MGGDGVHESQDDLNVSSFCVKSYAITQLLQLVISQGMNYQFLLLMECTGPGWSPELEDLLAKLECPMWWGAGWSHPVCVPLPNIDRQVHKQLVIFYFIPSKLVSPLETQQIRDWCVCVHM